MSALPWTGKQRTDPNYGINVTPNAPFYLTHHPQNWDLCHLDGEPEWLPKMSMLHEIPGVQGVRDTPRGPDSSMARLECMERGYTILPFDMGYLTRHPTKRGGFYYAIIWATPKEIANRVIWKVDQKGWNDFRRGLLLSGTIELPDPDLVELLMEAEEQKLQRYIPSQHLPEVRKKMDELIQKLKDMKTATESAHSPKKRRKK